MTAAAGQDERIGWLLDRIAGIAEPPRKPAEIAGGQRLREDLAVDSLGFIELMVAFEEQFDLRLDERDLLPGRYGTVADLTDYIEKHLPSRP